MKRLSFETTLCRIPNCPNELDADAPTRGRHAGMCEDCRKRIGVPIAMYLEARQAARDELAWRIPNRAQGSGRPRRVRCTVPTETELETLRALARGLMNNEIAAERIVSPETVKSHVKKLLEKLDAKNRTHLVAIAYQRGLL